MEKNIFQVWFQGAENLTDPSFIESSVNWRIMNKTWTYHLYSDNDLKKACYEFSPDCGKIYDEMDLMHLKIDFGRYVVLFLYGGIYVDMDMFPVKSLDGSEYLKTLFAKDKIWAVTKLNISKFESLLYIQQSFIVNNSMMIASKKNPDLKRFIVDVMNKWQVFKSLPKNSTKIQKITGPIFLNRFYNKNRGNMSLLPHFLFEPCNPDGLCDVKKTTVAIHKMELSWISENYKQFIRAYYKIKPFGFFYLFLIVFVVFLLIMIIL